MYQTLLNLVILGTVVIVFLIPLYFLLLDNEKDMRLSYKKKKRK